MAQPAAILNILIRADGLTQTSAGVGRLNSQLNATSKSANSTLLSMKSLAKGAALGGVALAVRSAVSSFVDFDRSMRNVNSIAQLSEKRFDELSKQVLKLAGPTAQSPKTLADGLYQLVSSGFDANQSIRILRKSAIAATAGLTDTATATQVVAAAINAYGLEAKDAGHVSDVLFKTVDRGVLTFGDLAQQLGPVLPSAKALNVSLEQVGAAMATLTKQGFPAAEAATALDATMRSLFKPSDALKDAFKQLGVTSGEELIAKFGTLQRALNVLRGTTDGSGTAFRKLFTEQRAGRGVMALTGEQARKAAKDVKALGDASGSTSKAFNEQSKSASVQWARLKAELSATAAEIGAVLFPILRRTIIILVGWNRILVKLPELWIAVGKAAFQAGKAIVGATTDAFRTVKKMAGDTIAFVLRRFADLFEVASHLPIIGDKFKGIADKVNRAADRVDKLGESIDGLPKRKQVDVRVRLSLKSLGGDNIAIPPGPGGDGFGIERDVRKVVNAGIANGSINPFGVVGALPMFGGSGGLMGASQALAPFAAIGQRFGLAVTSGLRPGVITSSGNLSLHALGRAIDVDAGSPAQMLAYARYMFANFGSRLKELIYTPMGTGIKDGQPVNIQSFYGSTVARDHYDHVHVAMEKGGRTVQKVRALVGEKGPEIVDLPAGSFVHTAQKTRQMLPGYAAGGWVRAAHAGRAAGFRGKALQMLLAIGGAESGNYTSFVGDGGQSFSPWQIYHPAHPQYNTSRLLSDWTYAARAAYEISSGGRNWSPWTMFNNGGYRAYLDDAARAIAATAKKPRRQTHRPRRAHRRSGSGGGSGGSTGRMSGGDIRDAFMGAFADQIAYRQAMADLTGDTSDDLAVANAAVSGWQGFLDLALKKGDQAGATTAATNLKQWQDTVAELTTATDEQNTLIEQQNELIQQQTAATEAHTGAVNELKDQQKRNEDLIRAQGPALEKALLSFVSMGLGSSAAGGRQMPGGAPGLGSLSRA